MNLNKGVWIILGHRVVLSSCTSLRTRACTLDTFSSLHNETDKKKKPTHFGFGKDI